MEYKKEHEDWLKILYDKQLSFRTEEEQNVIRSFIEDLFSSAVGVSLASKQIMDILNTMNKENEEKGKGTLF